MEVPVGGWVAPLLGLLEGVRLELLLFAGFWFIVGALDELGIDLAWLWLRLTGRIKRRSLPAPLPTDLRGPIALFVPAWQEARVIAPMLRHALTVWPHEDLVVFAGCYPNDDTTARAIEIGANGDARVRRIVNPQDGPTTKGDMLNALYRAMQSEEAGSGRRFRAVLLHDAEDLVHPDALSLIDRALDDADFVQIPVRPEPQLRSTWIAGHYADEFTEAHAREMVVRDRLGAGIPAAGVGCAFGRDALERVARQRSGEAGGAPFEPTAMTEDYELGMTIGRRGAHGDGKGGVFLRVRDANGHLVATRAYFPTTLDAAVRQKSRWIQGIAFDGWDRLGWGGGATETWMRLRDRRGPLVAMVLLAAYLLIVVTAVLWVSDAAGIHDARPLPPLVYWLLIGTTAFFVYRAAVRFVLVGREYGWAEGFAAVLRIPIANVIAIVAARRALFRYVAGLLGRPQGWEKTEHDRHPVQLSEIGRDPA